MSDGFSHLTKIGHNEFRIDFIADCVYSEYKNVIVDGEKYTKEWFVTKQLNSKVDFDGCGKIKDNIGFGSERYDKLKGEHWRRLIMDDFKDYNGQTYHVWNYFGFDQDPSGNLMGRSASTVGYVRLLTSLVDGGHVKLINSIYNGRQNRVYLSERESILKRRKVWFDIAKYGSGNSVSIGINLYRLIKMDFVDKKDTWAYRQVKLYTELFPDIFPPKMIRKKLTDTERTDILIDILNSSINQK